MYVKLNFCRTSVAFGNDRPALYGNLIREKTDFQKVQRKLLFGGRIFQNSQRKKTWLWEDLWNGGIPKIQSELFSFRKTKEITISEAKTLIPFHAFHLLLSEEAYAQYEALNERLDSITIQDESDSWTYIWAKSRFSSKKAYEQIIGFMPCNPIFKSLWKTSCENNQNFFLWLLIKDRLSTRELLKRRNMELPT